MGVVSTVVRTAAAPVVADRKPGVVMGDGHACAGLVEGAMEQQRKYEMTHDLRGALGYRLLKCSDPVEDDLRRQWYAADAARSNGDAAAGEHFTRVDDKLKSYLWKRACAEREEDRKKHPKARRNQVYTGPSGEGRALP